MTEKNTEKKTTKRTSPTELVRALEERVAQAELGLAHHTTVHRSLLERLEAVEGLLKGKGAGEANEALLEAFKALLQAFTSMPRQVGTPVSVVSDRTIPHPNTVQVPGVGPVVQTDSPE